MTEFLVGAGCDLKRRIMKIRMECVARALDLGCKWMLLVVGLTVVARPMAQARTTQHFVAVHAISAEEQTPSAGAQHASGAGLDLSAKTGATPPAFETVTIRPAMANDAQRSFGIQFTASGGLTFSSMTLNSLVMFAYEDLPEMQRVAGGPKWADSDAFDIHAQMDKPDMAGWEKLPGEQRMERLRALMQTMLQQRFQLKGHIAPVSTPAYVLVQAKGGSKLKEVPAPTPAELQEDQQRRRANKASDPPQFGLNVTPGGWAGHAVQVPELMSGLGYALSVQDKPILDQTGLAGYYDLTLKIVKQDNGPSPAQQVEEQLGLKFEARNAPIKTFLIDSAEKPTLDAPGAVAPTAVAEPAPRPLPHIHFDVVSWKRCGPAAKGSQKIDMPMDSDYVAYHCQPIQHIIYFAYVGPMPFRLSGHPAWVNDELYDFEAKVAPEDIAAWKALTINERRVAVRDILADQLKLQIHVDKTPQPAYALTVAKGGPKLTEYKIGEQWKIPDGRILEGRQHVFDGNISYFQNETMNNLSADLSAHLDRPVLDQTGLSDSYDISLPLAKAMGANPFIDLGEEEGSVDSGLQKLGLKLITAKIEVDGLLVDHIERPPVN
jgi:uncharacterized protein (TIGR03435 family)